MTEPRTCNAPLTDFVIDAGTCKRPPGHPGIHWFNDKGAAPTAAELRIAYNTGRSHGYDHGRSEGAALRAEGLDVERRRALAFIAAERGETFLDDSAWILIRRAAGLDEVTAGPRDVIEALGFDVDEILALRPSDEADR